MIFLDIFSDPRLSQSKVGKSESLAHSNRRVSRLCAEVLCLLISGPSNDSDNQHTRQSFAAVQKATPDKVLGACQGGTLQAPGWG